MTKIRNARKNKRSAFRHRHDRIYLQLSESIVTSRAGLIPSEDTDGVPPPESLSAAKLAAWHSGHEVRVKLTSEDWLRLAQPIASGYVRARLQEDI